MKEISMQLKKVMKSNSLREMFDNIPWEFTEFLAFVPMFMLAVLPLYQLINDILVPLSQMTYSINIQTIHKIAVMMGVITLIIRIAKGYVEKKIRLKSIISSYKPMIFFIFTIIMMIISTMINGFTDEARYGDIYRQESLFTFIIYFVIYFMYSSFITNKKLKAVILYTYTAASIPLAICAVIHSCVKPMEAFYMGDGLSTIFHQFNHYGYFLLMSILISAGLFIKEKNIISRIFCMISFILNNIVLIINDTFGCYLACFIALIFTVIVISLCEKKLNKLSLIMTMIFISISLIMSIWYETIFSNILTFTKDINTIAESSNNSSNAASAGTGRWTLWTHTVKYITEKPLFGFGVEGIHDRLANETNDVNNRPHCEFLQYAVFFGIPAAISYICGIFAVYLNGLKKRYELDIYTITALIAAFGYLVSSVFGNTMYYTAPYLFVFMGLGFSTQKNISQK